MIRRLLPILLCAAILFGCIGTVAGAWSEPLAVLYVGSDFQYPNAAYKGVTYPSTYDAGAAVMTELLKPIAKAYPHIDEALFLGDYEPSSYTAKSDGLETVRRVLQQTWGLSHDTIHFLQGNHDHYDMPGLDGAQLVFTKDYTYADKKGRGYVVTAERPHYYLCMIHEDAFPESRITDSAAVRSRKLQAVQETAHALQTYLTETLKGSGKPVIIMGHIPLHYSRQDNIYARYLVDALNEGAADGRNIIYLFGHNHSSGYDNYLGGSCVYYAPGSSMKVPNPQKADRGIHAWDAVSLGFTYLNGGYVSYTGTTEPGACLSSTVIEIHTDRVELRRYNDRGLTNLKNPGIANVAGVDLTLTPDAAAVPSPQTLLLSAMDVKVTDPIRQVLAPDTTDTLALQVTGAHGAVKIRWESTNEDVVKVEGTGRKVCIRALQGGSATVHVWITDGTGVGARRSFAIQVRHPEAVRLSDSPTAAVFRLVTDWNTLTPEGTYMILNTDRPGTAAAFAGARADGSRVKDGTLSRLTTAPQVYAMPTDNGTTVYTRNTHLYDQWHLQVWPHEGIAPGATWLLSSQNKVFTGASNSFDPAVRGYADATGLYMGSNANAAGTIGWVTDPDAKQLLLHSYRTGGDSVSSFATREGYGLFYNPDKGCFELSREGQPIYLYERVPMDLSQIWLWTLGEGNAVAGCSPDTDTGAWVVQTVMGKESRIPLTADMISGVDWNTPGVYRCTVTAYGKVLTEDFRLTLWEPEAVTPIRTLEVRDLYVSATGLQPGQCYAIVDGQTSSRAYALGMSSRTGAYPSVGSPTELLIYQGKQYAAVADDTCCWKATPVKPDNTRFRLENHALGGCLGAMKDRLILERDPKTLWQYNKTSLQTADGRKVACSGGIFHTTGKPSQVQLYRLGEPDGLITKGYLTATEGSVRAGQWGQVIMPGGNLVVSYRLSDTAEEMCRRELPITYAMLRGISLRELMQPGTYTCSVWYGDAMVYDGYILTVE